MDHELLALFKALDDSPIEREGYIRSPIPYPGSKARSLDKLLPHLPVRDVWCDVFGGSASVTLSRRKSKFEIFNDKHSGVVCFFRCLRDKKLCQELVDLLELTIHSREDFLLCRDTWDYDLTNELQVAFKWYYTTIYSFGAAGRNFGRSLNTKATLSGRIHKNLELFQPVHERFREIQVENLDWRLCLKDYDSSETTFYLDPPYYGTTVNKKYDMKKEEHIEICQRIFDCKGFVALSGYANPIYDRFPWDKKESWKAHVSMTTKATKTDTSNVTEVGESQSEECLWIKEAY